MQNPKFKASVSHQLYYPLSGWCWSMSKYMQNMYYTSLHGSGEFVVSAKKTAELLVIVLFLSSRHFGNCLKNITLTIKYQKPHKQSPSSSDYIHNSKNTFSVQNAPPSTNLKMHQQPALIANQQRPKSTVKKSSSTWKICHTLNIKLFPTLAITNHHPLAILPRTLCTTLRNSAHGWNGSSTHPEWKVQ